MPGWHVREALAELCGIPRALMRELNEFIDSVEDPRFHDANRVIVEGRWDPEALVYAGSVVLKKWGYEGLRAFLHHNLLDYAEQLALSRRVREIRTGSYEFGWIEGLVRKVLDNIVKDFEALLTLTLRVMLEKHTERRNLAEEVEKIWGIKLRYAGDLVRLIEEGEAVNLSASMIEAAQSLYECLSNSVYDFVAFYLSFPKDYCVACKAFVSPSERHVIYADLEYVIHEECLTRLRGRVGALISKANEHAKKAIYRYIVREWALPPTVVYRVIYREARGT